MSIARASLTGITNGVANKAFCVVESFGMKFTKKSADLVIDRHIRLLMMTPQHQRMVKDMMDDAEALWSHVQREMKQEDDDKTDEPDRGQ